MMLFFGNGIILIQLAVEHEKAPNLDKVEEQFNLLVEDLAELISICHDNPAKVRPCTKELKNIRNCF